MPTPPLLTHPRLRALAPDPPAVVSVRNLRATLHRSGHDAWNRPGKQQPCLISVEVGFLSEFDTAASTDRLGADTLHYGMLSKAVLGCVSAVEAEEKDVIGLEGEKGVVHVLKAVWMDLTALELDGRPRDAGWMRQGKAVVDLRRVRFLSVTVALPKASLLGEGVSLTASAVFDAGGSGTMEARAMALEITRLRVPTLVGVNDNERLAKQFVIVTVTLEGLVREQDFYTHIERDVVQVRSRFHKTHVITMALTGVGNGKVII